MKKIFLTALDVFCLVTLSVFCFAVWLRTDFDTARYTWELNS